MRGTRFMLWLLSLSLVLAQACTPNTEQNGPTPIEQMLAQDSALRASDSSYQHIAFDYENLNRVVWQKPDLLVERLGNLSGKTVVEVGSGTGFFTRRLAKQAAKVIALDIDPGMLLMLDSLNAERLDTAAYARVDPRLVPPGDPKLGEKEGDAALVVNTFMYIPDGPDYLRKLSAGLKAGSAVLIVDFKAENTPLGPPLASRLTVDDVADALKSAGYTDITTDNMTLDYQYIVRGLVK